MADGNFRPWRGPNLTAERPQLPQVGCARSSRCALAAAVGPRSFTHVAVRPSRDHSAVRLVRRALGAPPEYACKNQEQDAAQYEGKAYGGRAIEPSSSD